MTGWNRARPGVAIAWLVLVLAVVFGASVPSAALADLPQLRRGINLEAWQSWRERPFVLSPAFDPDLYPDWRAQVSPEQLAALRSQGFDFIRLNVDPSPLLWRPADAQRMIGSVTRTVRLLQELGFAVVVDLHLMPDMDNRPDGVHAVLGTGSYKGPDRFESYLGLVALFAKALADFPPDRTALEVLNEPDQDWFSYTTLTDRWPGQLRALHRAARDNAPSLPLVLSGARGGGIEGLERISPDGALADPKVIWSFHYYEPFAITHSGLPWERNASHFLVGLPYPAAELDDASASRILEQAYAAIEAQVQGEADRRALQAQVRDALAAYRASGAGPQSVARDFGRVRQWAAAHSIPPARILLGEFGVFQDSVMPQARAGVLRAIRTAAEDEGFAWAVYTAGLTSPGRSFAVVGDGANLALDPAARTALGLP